MNRDCAIRSTGARRGDRGGVVRIGLVVIVVSRRKLQGTGLDGRRFRHRKIAERSHVANISARAGGRSTRRQRAERPGVVPDDFIVGYGPDDVTRQVGKNKIRLSYTGAGQRPVTTQSVSPGDVRRFALRRLGGKRCRKRSHRRVHADRRITVGRSRFKALRTRGSVALSEITIHVAVCSSYRRCRRGER